MTRLGRFAGKFTFGSDPAQGETVYLTARKLPSGRYAPAMMASTAGDEERVTWYRQDDGTLLIALPGPLWITLDEASSLGYLSLSADFTQAARLTTETVGKEQRWTVRTSQGEERRVRYTLDTVAPLMTTKGSEDMPDLLHPASLAPSLTTIQQTKDAFGADLSDVDLAGQDLSQVDLSQADLRGADLTGTRFDGATLHFTRFAGATLAGIRCEGADLDDANFTGTGLDGLAWGTPSSARRLSLSQSSARGFLPATKPTDFTGANFSATDLTGADLRQLTLTGAQFPGAVLDRCRLDSVDLTGASLRDAVAVGAVLRRATLRQVDAHGAVLARADLSGADLFQARMGANAFLFPLTGIAPGDLESGVYVTSKVIAAFAAQGGITLRSDDKMRTVQAGKRWLVLNDGGPYDIRLTDSTMDVYNDAPHLRPAVLHGASCVDTKASGAGLAKADLRGVRWHGPRATLDHADLEGAVLTGGLFVGTDISQAFLAGADFTGAVLIQAKLRGCSTTSGEGGHTLCLSGALLHGADLSETVIRSGSAVGATVATAEGAPLFSLPASDRESFDKKDVPALAPKFANAGFPLSDNARISATQLWLLDNSGSGDPGSPRRYKVMTMSTRLRVMNADNDQHLFYLASEDKKHLEGAAPTPALVRLFKDAGYALDGSAPITARTYWTVITGTGTPTGVPTSYGTLRVFPTADRLRVTGVSPVRLRDHPEYTDGVAFGATANLTGAFDANTLGPSGHPRRHVDEGLLDRDLYLTPASTESTS
ncbi:pentapeptide repeat-containing protein [Streptomyces sp. NPDC051173]|uniref:pentapeptide repeat-containing protein n=1 Tax=Streptomyces sp. NPDC051173 TaxID=3155164 RepID=UPI00344E6D0F